MFGQSGCVRRVLVAVILVVGWLPSAIAQNEIKPEAKGKKGNREQALEWIRTNQATGYNLVESARKHLDALPIGKPDFQFELGSELLKSGKATWLLGWRGRFWAVELSAAHSRVIDRNAITKTALNPLEDLGEVRTDFEIAKPEFDGDTTLPADKEVTGRLPFKNLGRESKGYPSIRLTYWDEKDRHVQYSHYLSKSVAKEDKEFKFKFPKPDVRPGAVIYILDVVEYPDAERSATPIVVSNPVVVLVDITAGKGSVGTKMVRGRPVKGLVNDKGDATFVELVDNVMFLSRRDYYISKFPKEMAGGHMLLRADDQANRWLTPGQLTLAKDAMAYVAIVTRAGGKERISGRQLAMFFNDGWKLAEGKFETTSPEGENWRWEILRKKIEKGPLSLTLPKGIGTFDTPVIYFFK